MRREYRLSDGTLLVEGQPYFDGEYHRPSDFLHRASSAELASAGVTVAEVPDDGPAAPTASDVDHERDRRLRYVTFQGRQFDFLFKDAADNISGAAVLALAAIINGAQPHDFRWSDPIADFAWIAADNTSVPMDAQSTFAFGQAAAAWKSRHIHAARIIKNMTPIPADYTDNSRWPS